MKLADNPPKIIDEVITEVRAIKRTIAERHGNDINRLLNALIAQERSAGSRKAEQGVGGQPPISLSVSPQSLSNGGGATT